MSISLKTRVLVWGRAAGRCSFPGCGRDLVMDATETDDASLVGDIAHIVAESDHGPRADPAVPTEERDKYANLLLLCKVDHKRVDDQPGAYPVDRLREIKREHEARVRDALSQEGREDLRAKGIYATIVEDWLAALRPDFWMAWSSWMLSADGPRMSKAAAERLAALGDWLLARVWPRKYLALEQSLENFRRVLNDLLAVFYRYAEDRGGELMTRKFYKIPEWNPDLYHRLSDQHEHHVGLVAILFI